jgi:hypothetical protein
MKLKRVVFANAPGIGGKLSGMSADSADARVWESIELDRARTTVALVPADGGDVLLVPWAMCKAASCALEDFTAPAVVPAKGK